MRMLVISDDMTGALDTAVKLSNRNMSVLVPVNPNKLSKENIEKYDVIVIDSDSRHMDPLSASKKIRFILEGFKEYKPEYIYKKTDSALRGNIGSELTTLLDFSESKELHFIPAYPDLKRNTIDGIHYIDGVQLNRSVFAQDPFEPVLFSRVADIIAQQSDILTLEAKEVLKEDDEKKIIIYDAQTNDDIYRIASRLKQENRIQLLAGCAGFLDVLTELLDFRRVEPLRFESYERFLVISGSVNPVTRSQIKHALEKGFGDICLDKDELGRPDFSWDSGYGLKELDRIRQELSKRQEAVIYLSSLFGEVEKLATEKRFRIADRIGELVQILFQEDKRINILITGGDTLRGFFNYSNLEAIIPGRELIDGIVQSKTVHEGHDISIISKSGGFGSPDAFVRISEKLKEGVDDERDIGQLSG